MLSGLFVPCTVLAAQPQSQLAAGFGVVVTEGWVRSIGPGQQSTAAYMKLKAPVNVQLIDVSTPAAEVAEVHEMILDGNVMKMRARPYLELPAGTTVEMKPGGIHVMLMLLNQPLLKKARIPLTLRFKSSQGLESTLAVTLPVVSAAPGSASAKPAVVSAKPVR